MTENEFLRELVAALTKQNEELLPKKRKCVVLCGEIEKAPVVLQSIQNDRGRA